MAVEAVVNQYLALVGGLSGAAALTYMILMLRFNARKDRKLEAIELRLAKIEGVLLGRKK